MELASHTGSVSAVIGYYSLLLLLVREFCILTLVLRLSVFLWSRNVLLHITDTRLEYMTCFSQWYLNGNDLGHVQAETLRTICKVQPCLFFFFSTIIACPKYGLFLQPGSWNEEDTWSRAMNTLLLPLTTTQERNEPLENNTSEFNVEHAELRGIGDKFSRMY